jgi:hypothetical protein
VDHKHVRPAIHRRIQRSIDLRGVDGPTNAVGKPLHPPAELACGPFEGQEHHREWALKDWQRMD